MKKIFKLSIILLLIFTLAGCANNVVVTYIVDGINYSKEIEKETIIQKSLFSEIKEDYIEDIFLNQEYTIKYENEPITNDITLYIKIKEITVTFIINGNSYNKKMNIGFNLNNISFEDVNESDILGYYYDEEFTKNYNNEVLEEDKIIFIKTKIGQTRIDAINELQEFISNNKYNEIVFNKLFEPVIENIKLSNNEEEIKELKSNILLECSKYLASNDIIEKLYLAFYESNGSNVSFEREKFDEYFYYICEIDNYHIYMRKESFLFSLSSEIPTPEVYDVENNKSYSINQLGEELVLSEEIVNEIWKEYKAFVELIK